MPVYYPRTIANPDDTRVPAPADARKDSVLVFTPPTWPTVGGLASLDALTAVQIGMWQILASLRPVSLDTEEYLRSGRVEAREMAVSRVMLDWPDMSEDQVPIPSFTIAQAAPATYDAEDLVSYLDDTEDAAAYTSRGYVLRKLAHMQASLRVICRLGTKDDRAGVRRALEEALLAEPLSERRGRRVQITPYYDRVARYMLTSIAYPDDADEARSNHWDLEAIIAADIPVVSATSLPAEYRGPLPALEVGEDVTPDP